MADDLDARRPAGLHRPPSMPTSSGPLRVLTVGDGDLSYSLALARAYGDRIRLTASVLPTTEELVATYAAAAACMEELRARGATVMYWSTRRRWLSILSHGWVHRMPSSSATHTSGWPTSRRRLPTPGGTAC